MKQEFDCKGPRCTEKVQYDSEDPNNYSIGALLRKRNNKGPLTVYLTCENGHVNSYTPKNNA